MSANSQSELWDPCINAKHLSTKEYIAGRKRQRVWSSATITLLPFAALPWPLILVQDPLEGLRMHSSNKYLGSIATHKVHALRNKCMIQ